MANDVSPVFIGGAPRSGTTMVASAMGESPDVVTLPELHVFYKLLWRELVFGEVNKDWLISELYSDSKFKDLGLFESREELADWVGGGGNARSLFFNIYSRYNEVKAGKGYRVCVEHTPHSIFYLNELKCLFPEAKFVHVLRDGRAVFASLRKTPWGQKDVLSGAKVWRRRVEAGLAGEKLLGQDVHRLFYEEVVTNFEEEFSGLCSHIGINFNSDMKNAGGLELPSWSRNQKKIGGGVQASSLDAWKTNLSTRELSHFEYTNGDLLDFLGYKRLFKKEKAFPIKGVSRLALGIFGKVRQKYSQKMFQRRIRRAAR